MKNVSLGEAEYVCSYKHAWEKEIDKHGGERRKFNSAGNSRNKHEKNFHRPKERRSPSARKGVGGQAEVGLRRLSPERLGKWTNSWNACLEVCLESGGKVNSLSLFGEPRK